MLLAPLRALTFCLALLGLTSSGFSQTVEYLPGQVEIDGVSYPYLLLPPAELVEGESYPLILFLHGAGERGTDNAAQKRHFPERMAKAQAATGQACFVLAPQCPKGVWWTPRTRGGQRGDVQPPPVASMQAVMAALQEVVRSQPIDRERISLTGLSMGGFGTWDLAMRQPTWFSAVVPVCGGGDPRMVARLAGLPVQVWHGDADRSVPVAMSQQMVEAMRALKLPVQYTELPGVGHDSWNQAYRDAACLKLLMSSKRDPAAMQAETVRLLAEAIDPNERIAFLGDSITQAGNRPKGYVDQVRTGIAALRPEAGVIPAGISGHKVPDLLARYQRDVLDQKATMVFIYIGINDVWHSNSGKGTPIDEFEAGLRKLIQDFRASGAEVVLATPTVIGEKPQGQNGLDEMLEDFSAVSRRVATEEGATLCDLRQSFFDYLSIFNPQDLAKGVLTSDSVHLNPAGNTFLAIEAARALRVAALKRSARRAAEAKAEPK
jgi:lysophospholipase L1-like esterase/predicted esterase